MPAILARIHSWYVLAVNAHSVDGILADFNKKFKQLHVAAKFHDAQAKLHDDEILWRTALKRGAHTQAVRARSIADRIKDLVA